MGRFVQFNPSDPVRPFNLSGRPFPLMLSSYVGTEKAEERNKEIKTKKKDKRRWQEQAEKEKR